MLGLGHRLGVILELGLRVSIVIRVMVTSLRLQSLELALLLG